MAHKLNEYMTTTKPTTTTQERWGREKEGEREVVKNKQTKA